MSNIDPDHARRLAEEWFGSRAHEYTNILPAWPELAVHYLDEWVFVVEFAHGPDGRCLGNDQYTMYKFWSKDYQLARKFKDESRYRRFAWPRSERKRWDDAIQK